MEEKEKYRVIRLSVETMERIKKHGLFGESYDTVINKRFDIADSRAKK